MKNLIALFFLLLLVGCGKEYVHTVTELPVEVEKSNPAEEFVGNWYGEDSRGAASFLSISMTADGLIEIESYDQVLTSYNKKSKTYSTHPTISLTNLPVRDGKILILNKNYNYSSSTHDIEYDKTTSNITGNHRTDITMELTEDKELKIVIKIYEGAVNSNVNNVIAKRTFVLN